MDPIPLQCANSECGRRRESLSEGEVFQFEIVSISVAASDEQDDPTPFDEVPQREKVFFWLCDSCCELATLTLDPVKGLQMVPRESAEKRPIPFAESRRSSPELSDQASIGNQQRQRKIAQ